MLLAFSLFMRAYMGILLPITLGWVLVHNRATAGTSLCATRRW